MDYYKEFSGRSVADISFGRWICYPMSQTNYYVYISKNERRKENLFDHNHCVYLNWSFTTKVYLPKLKYQLSALQRYKYYKKPHVYKTKKKWKWRKTTEYCKMEGYYTMDKIE